MGFCVVLITFKCGTWKLYCELISGRQYKQEQQPAVRSAAITTASTITSFILTAAAAATAAAATTAVTAAAATAATKWFNLLGTGSWQGTTGQSASECREFW